MKRILIFDDHAVFVSPAIQTEQHKHHALELIVSSEKPFVIKDNEGNSLTAHVVLVTPDQLHQTTTASLTTFIFIEPESDLARKISNAFFPTRVIQSLDDSLSAAEKEALLVGDIPESFTVPAHTTDKFDDRIKNVTDFIRSHIMSHEFDLNMLAEIACLSSGRLTHLFKEQIGIPLRPYILWCRMRVAVMAVLSGMSITQAAHEAGFADTAHLSRTFLDMFGVNPSQALKQ